MIEIQLTVTVHVDEKQWITDRASRDTSDQFVRDTIEREARTTVADPGFLDELSCRLAGTDEPCPITVAARMSTVHDDPADAEVPKPAGGSGREIVSGTVAAYLAESAVEEPQLTDDELDQWWNQVHAPQLHGLPADALDHLRARNAESARSQPGLRRQVRTYLAEPAAESRQRHARLEPSWRTVPDGTVAGVLVDGDLVDGDDVVVWCGHHHHVRAGQTYLSAFGCARYILMSVSNLDWVENVASKWRDGGDQVGADLFLTAVEKTRAWINQTDNQTGGETT